MGEAPKNLGGRAKSQRPSPSPNDLVPTNCGRRPSVYKVDFWITILSYDGRGFAFPATN